MTSDSFSDAQTSNEELPQLLDLKLRLAEALSTNDTLRHQTTLLTRHTIGSTSKRTNCRPTSTRRMSKLPN